MFSALTAEDLTDTSLHAVLGEKYGVRITSGKRQIRAAPGDADLLQLLQLDAGSPTLLLEGTSYDQHGAQVEVFSTWHHPDHVVFDIERKPATSAGGSPSGIGSGPGTVAEGARRLSPELLRFAEQASSTDRETP